MGGHRPWYASIQYPNMLYSWAGSIVSSGRMFPQITFKLNTKFRHDPEASVFVSHCPALGIFSQGDSQEQAVEAIREAAALYLQTAYAHDRLEQVLRRIGFVQLAPLPPGVNIAEVSEEFISVTNPELELLDDVEIEVPLYLLAQYNVSNTSGCLQ